MDTINEQTEPKTQTAEAEKEEGVERGEVSLGKFKDVEALLSAYNSLQSEFTKRCQRIKELESEKIAVEKAQAPTERALREREDTTGENKEEILKEYLLEVLGKKSTAILLDGVGASVKAPINRPRSIEEAGKLAQNIFNKKD